MRPVSCVLQGNRFQRHPDNTSCKREARARPASHVSFFSSFVPFSLTLTSTSPSIMGSLLFPFPLSSTSPSSSSARPPPPPVSTPSQFISIHTTHSLHPSFPFSPAASASTIQSLPLSFFTPASAPAPTS